MKYLGDIINTKNNNEDMLKEKGQKATHKLISIFATVNEITFGAFQYDALLLLYHSFYLPTIIFNCQSWTNLSSKDIMKLRTIQLKFLKKLLRVPQSTSNCFVYLETGLLPIEHEIYRRQFSFLHHILKLSDDDPVRMMYKQMKDLPNEKNWAMKLEEMKEIYNIHITDDEIQKLSIDNFKKTVKEKIRACAFQELKEECSAKEKTKKLTYNIFKQQSYISNVPPKYMYIIIKMRCSMLNTIHERPYMYPGTKKCRLCRMGDESLLHIINCYVVSDKLHDINTTIYTDDPDKDYLMEIAMYIERFLDEEELLEKDTISI